MGGWGKFFGKFAEQFQGRVERLKNEDARLKKEKEELERKPCNEKISERITVIDDRRTVIAELLKNAAKD